MKNKHDDLSDDLYFKIMCMKCKKANGHCIKNEPYVGLCAKLDREELLELRRKKK